MILFPLTIDISPLNHSYWTCKPTYKSSRDHLRPAMAPARRWVRSGGGKSGRVEEWTQWTTHKLGVGFFLGDFWGFGWIWGFHETFMGLFQIKKIVYTMTYAR